MNYVCTCSSDFLFFVFQVVLLIIGFRCTFIPQEIMVYLTVLHKSLLAQEFGTKFNELCSSD